MRLFKYSLVRGLRRAARQGKITDADLAAAVSYLSTDHGVETLEAALTDDVEAEARVMSAMDAAGKVDWAKVLTWIVTNAPTIIALIKSLIGT